MNEIELQEKVEMSDEYQLIVPSYIEETNSYEGNPIKEKVLAALGAIAVTGLLVVSSGIITNLADPDGTKESGAIAVAPRILESVPKPPETPHPFYAVSVGARAAIVYDVREDRVLFGRNEDKQLPLASLTKLMTALVTVESLNEDDHIVISPNSLAAEGDSGLYANESWKVSDLVNFTMISSSNDGANALAAAVGSLWQSTPSQMEGDTEVQSFVDRMNFRADELGLDNTRYTNPTGLDNSRPGGIGTAEDISKLLAYIWENNPSAIQYTNELEHNFISLDNFEHVAENTNEHVYKIPGMLGGKTGYTDQAGGNLAVIYDSGLDHPIVVVVLGSTLDGRFTDVEALVDATYEYISSGWYDYEMNVGGSTAQTVNS